MLFILYFIYTFVVQNPKKNMAQEKQLTEMEQHAAEIIGATVAAPTKEVTPPAEPATPAQTTQSTQATTQGTESAVQNTQTANETDEQKILAEYQKETFSTKPAEEEIDLTGLDAKYVEYINKLKNKQAETKVEVKTELPQDIQEKLNKADKYFNNELVSKLAEYLSDGDVDNKIQELFLRNEKDYSKASNDEILSEYFQSLYSNDANKVAQAIKDFKEVNQKQYQQDKGINEMRSALASKNTFKPSDKFNELIAKNLESAKQKNAAVTAERENINKLYQQSIAQADTTLKGLKEFNGITISDADRKELLDFAAYHVPSNRSEKGITFDTQKAIDIALKVRYFDEVRKQERLAGFSDGMKKFYRPSVSQSSNVNAAGKGEGSSSMAEAAQKEYLNREQIQYKQK